METQKATNNQSNLGGAQAPSGKRARAPPHAGAQYGLRPLAQGGTPVGPG